jgi:hypothetical protein
MYNRFFAFGCSYTHWCWPTWADIISWDLDIPYENWGRPGIGNVGIFHRMVECDLKNNFKENDLVITLWTSWTREDRYLKNNWESHGNVFNNPLYDKRFLSKYWSISNDIIKNSTAIIAGSKIANINFQGHIMFPGNFETNNMPYKDSELTLKEFYSQHFPSENIFDEGNAVYTTFNEVVKEGHPSILRHLKYVKEKIYPKLNFTLKPSTEKLCNQMEVEIIKELKGKNLSMEENIKIIKDMLKTKFNLNYGKMYGF